MDLAYLLMCGMAWTNFGSIEAGEELIRALTSPDPELRTMARALLEEGGERSKQLVGEAVACCMLSPSQARLCQFAAPNTPTLLSLAASHSRPSA